MATTRLDNGEYALRCYDRPNRVRPRPQAAEIEPRPARLPEAGSSSHWHNVIATFSTQRERTGSRSVGHSPLLIEKTKALESRWSEMAEAIASCTWSSAPALSEPRKRVNARNSNANSSRRCERRAAGINARISAGPAFDSSQ
jgi:hypothetical protein